MKMICKVLLTAAAIAALAAPAVAADKLIVKDSTGTNAVFKVDDTGNVLFPSTLAGKTAALANGGGTLLNFGLLAVVPDPTVANAGAALQMVPRGTGYNANIKAQMTVFNTDYGADATNYEAMVLRAAGTKFSINSVKSGTGTLRPIEFQLQNTAKLVIDVTGYVGIGTSAPKAPLHVVGLPTYASNAAAITAGLTAGAFYTDGAGNVKVVY
jgi:hypothetical protein